MIGSMTHYQVLGVPESADPATLRRAYRRLVKRWHPDVCAKAGADGFFRRIDLAYRTLMDPMRRVTYDQALQWQRSRDRMAAVDRGWASVPHRADPPRTWTPPESARADRPRPHARSADRTATTPRPARAAAARQGGAVVFWLALLVAGAGLTRLALWPPRNHPGPDGAALSVYGADVDPRATATLGPREDRRHADPRILSPAPAPPSAAGGFARPGGSDPARPAAPAGPFSPPPAAPQPPAARPQATPRAQAESGHVPNGWAIPAPTGSPRTKPLKFIPGLPDLPAPNPLPDGAWGMGEATPPR